MKDVLVVYESKYGQAAKIAAFVGRLVRRRGLEAQVVRVANGLPDLGRHAAVIVVSPVYFGRHPRSVERFLRDYTRTLAPLPVAFVSVSNAAASPDQRRRALAMRLARRFIADLDQRPAAILTAGGAIDYPHYNVFVRFVMKHLARRAGAPTDVSRFHELTDFAGLERDLAVFLGGLVRPILVRMDDCESEPAPHSSIRRRRATPPRLPARG